jgi:geranylgeranyl diphosphate synthase type II
MEHLEAGGQRVRAKVCMDAARRLALSEADSVCLASVCELLHNASLIQDDLLDRTPTRRGAPSIWNKYGDTVAVCAGDLMLSAAYGVLSEISMPVLIASALRLVHLRTQELILGEAAEATAHSAATDTVSCYERLAKGKSASLLSLSLELPLLVSGRTEYQEEAHRAAIDFATVYQIADDLADFAQDQQEGSPNLLLMLIEREHLSAADAYATAIDLASARLVSMQKRAELLPNDCGTLMIVQAEMLRIAMAEAMQAA